MKEIRIAGVTVKEEQYFVIYPFPSPAKGPEWLLLDADGGPVCVDKTVDALRGFVPDEFVDALEAAADAAVESGAGEPLDERLGIPSVSAISLAEDLGWLARYGPSSQDILLPSTPVFFFGGLPAGLREKSVGAIHMAVRLLADCVPNADADTVSAFESIPEDVDGCIVTAAELAAS